MNKIIVALMALLTFPALGQEVAVTLTVDPTTGIETVTPTLTWNSNAATCEASGGWTGTKAPSGSETLPPINTTTTYGMLCSAADGSATLTWTPPTQYTNGNPLPLADLGGFKAFYGPQGNVAATTIDIPDRNATTYQITGLTAAEWEFAMTAYLNPTLGGIESDRTNSVFKVVQVPASSAQATATVQLKPNPPTLVTVESVVYEIKLHPTTLVASLGRRVGVIAYGVPCQGDSPLVVNDRGGYYAVPTELALVTKPAKSDVLVARCAAM